MKKVFFLLFFSTSVLGQSTARIGEWTSFLPFQLGLEVTQSEDYIYYSTEEALLKIEKTERSTSQISKVDGLNDIGIRRIEFDPFNSRLVVAYDNSNIDIVSSSGIINIPNIESNNDLTGDKQIYDIHISDGGSFYLGTGFGLVEIDSESLLFGFTTFTGIPVLDVTTNENSLYIATEEGIYRVKNDDSQNLIDFSLWELLGASQGLPSFYSSRSITTSDDILYFEADNVLYSFQDELATSKFVPDQGFEINFLSSDGPTLMIGLRHPQFDSKVIFYNDGQITESNSDCSDRVTDVLEDQYGRVWFGDAFGGFRSGNSRENSCERLAINSPFSQEVSDISIKNSQTFVASGGVKDNFDYQFTRSGYYIQEDLTWTNFNPNQTTFLGENDLLNSFRILPHPEEDILFIGTYWGGLIRHDLADNSFTLFDDTNSELLGTVGDEQRERITGLAFDDNKNLWVTSFGSPKPISVLTNDQKWYGFGSISNNNIIDVEVDGFGNLWMPAFGNNGGCIIYHPGDDITSSDDDRYRFISTFNSSLTSNTINTVAVDLDSEVWLGTAEGPVVFDCGDDPFNNEDCLGNRIKVEQDSIVAFLLADQDILSIEIDGANQKWFGSRNGIFVQSPDGEIEVLRFTEKNSPLFDNRVRDMSYNRVTGEMVIGTDAGLQSYRTQTTSGSNRHRENEVRIFPNPVHPDYIGPIAIRGLIRDAFVQITDVNGQLVSEVRALGGQAIWDGEDLQGRPVKSGIYLIFSSDDRSFDTPDAFVSKLMVIR